MKSTLKKFFITLIIIVIIGYFGVTSIYSLVGPSIMTTDIDTVISNPDGDYKFAKGMVYAGFPCIGSVENTINGIIPTGTEYYYVIFNKAHTSCMVVKAPDGWDMDYFPDLINKDGVELSGQIKEMDYHARDFYSAFLNHYKFTDAKYSSKYIDLTSTRTAYWGLGAFLGLAIGGFMVYLAVKQKIKNRNALIASTVILTLGVICMVVYI